MKLCIKKIYCPGCKRLVKGHEESINSNVRISCCKCGRPIWVHDSLNWRYVK